MGGAQDVSSQVGFGSLRQACFLLVPPPHTTLCSAQQPLSGRETEAGADGQVLASPTPALPQHPGWEVSLSPGREPDTPLWEAICHSHEELL